MRPFVILEGSRRLPFKLLSCNNWGGGFLLDFFYHLFLNFFNGVFLRLFFRFFNRFFLGLFFDFFYHLRFRNLFLIVCFFFNISICRIIDNLFYERLVIGLYNNLFIFFYCFFRNHLLNAVGLTLFFFIPIINKQGNRWIIE